MASGSESAMILALHGFLGLPSDWNSVLEDRRFHAVDLWKDIAEIGSDSGDGIGADTASAFAVWTAKFIRFVESQALKAERAGNGANADTRPVLIGYSMGGRLAMHALIARPDLFRAAVIVSAHPGLTSEAERNSRKESDERWAQLFLNEPWEALMSAWNGQGVLSAPASASAVLQDSRRNREFDREEKSFDRELLARAMRVWSLARQKDLRPGLANLDLPILFLSGGEDAKFTELMGQIPLNGSQKREVVPRAGHRLPWDDPAAFRQALDRFCMGQY